MARGVGCLIVAMIVLAACTAAPQLSSEESLFPASPLEEPRFERGQRMASRLCASCHAVGTSGDSHEERAPPLRLLAERYPGALLDDGFRQRMRVGHPAMPDFRFSDEEVDALLEYILAIQERQGA